MHTTEWLPTASYIHKLVLTFQMLHVRLTTCTLLCLQHRARQMPPSAMCTLLGGLCRLKVGTDMGAVQGAVQGAVLKGPPVVQGQQVWPCSNSERISHPTLSCDALTTSCQLHCNCDLPTIELIMHL